MPDVWLGRDAVVTIDRGRRGARGPPRPSRGRARRAVGGPLTTYRCGGPLAVLVRIDARPTSTTLAAVARRRSPTSPVLVIGRGSNLLDRRRGLRRASRSCSAASSSASRSIPAAPRVDGGRRGRAARCSPARRPRPGIGGLEFYVGIPGSVGGAVRMNAGGHGAQTERRARRRRGCSICATAPTARSTGSTTLGLGYRHSALGPREVVRRRRRSRAAPTIPRPARARIDEIVRWRREHQPGGQNAGSVFTNPPGDAAGRLIDACGLQGSAGRAESSCRRSTPTSSWPSPARAPTTCSRSCGWCRTRVEAATGVRLEPELQLVGFADAEEVER